MKQMKQEFAIFRENMINYRRQYNKTHEFIDNHYSNIDIRNEIEKPELFKNAKIIAYMNNGYIHSITFSNISCDIADIIKKDLCCYGVYYQTQGINTNWKLIHHPSIIYEIEKVEHNDYDKVSLNVYVTITCLKCKCRLNQRQDIFNIKKWFNIRNINYYKQLLEHKPYNITEIDETKIYFEIVKAIKANLQPGDVMDETLNETLE